VQYVPAAKVRDFGTELRVTDINDDNDRENMIENRQCLENAPEKNGAKAMAEAEEIPRIDPAEVAILIERVKQNKLEERETELRSPKS